MTKVVQQRRMSATGLSSYVGRAGQLVINTTTWEVHVMDGLTAGGTPAHAVPAITAILDQAELAAAQAEAAQAAAEAAATAAQADYSKTLRLTSGPMAPLADAWLRPDSLAAFNDGKTPYTVPIATIGTAIKFATWAEAATSLDWDAYTAAEILNDVTLQTVSRERAGNIAKLVFSAAHGLAIGDQLVLYDLGGAGYWDPLRGYTVITVATVPTTTSITFASTGSAEATTADTAGRADRNCTIQKQGARGAGSWKAIGKTRILSLARQSDLLNEVARATAAEASEATTRAAADAAEASARAAAVTAEATARTNADTTLQANITAEINARAAAVTAEATARANADTTLQTNITAEVNARAAAVSAEATARTNADTTLQANITAEATARANADTAETAARVAAINAITSAQSGDVAALQASISAEVSARTAADAAEASARIAADGTLSTSILSEASSRAAADAVLQAGKADKTVRVTGAELAKGGGDLSGDRDITVSPASHAQAVAGVATDVAMTPENTTDHFNARSSAYVRSLMTSTDGYSLLTAIGPSMAVATEAGPQNVRFQSSAANGGVISVAGGAGTSFSIPSGQTGVSTFVGWRHKMPAWWTKLFVGCTIEITVRAQLSSNFLADKALITSNPISVATYTLASSSKGTLVSSTVDGADVLTRVATFVLGSDDREFGQTLQVASSSGTSAHSLTILNSTFRIIAFPSATGFGSAADAALVAQAFSNRADLGAVFETMWCEVSQQNGGTLRRGADGRALGLTIPIGSTGLNSYIMTRLPTDPLNSARYLAGARLIVVWEITQSTGFSRTLTPAFSTRYDISSNRARTAFLLTDMMVSTTKRLIVAAVDALVGDEVMVDPYLLISGGSAVSGADETIDITDCHMSIVWTGDKARQPTAANTSMLAARLHRRIGAGGNLLPLVTSALYALNNATKSDLKLLVPAGYTGASSYWQLAVPLSGTDYLNRRLRIRLGFDVSDVFTRTFVSTTPTIQYYKTDGTTANLFTAAAQIKLVTVGTQQRWVIEAETKITDATMIELRPFIQLNGSAPATSVDEYMRLTDFTVEVMSTIDEMMQPGDETQMIARDLVRRQTDARMAARVDLGWSRSDYDVVLTCSPDGSAAYTHPMDANASIIDASPTKRYCILLRPGDYQRADAYSWKLKNYVDIVAQIPGSARVIYRGPANRLPSKLQQDQGLWINSTSRVYDVAFIGRNCRYTTHMDDNGDGTAANTTQVFVRCTFVHEGNQDAVDYQTAIAGSYNANFALADAVFTASLAGGVMTVTAVTSGTIVPNSVLTYGGSTSVVTAQLTGIPGGVGTYSVVSTSTIASMSMSTTSTFSIMTVTSLTSGQVLQSAKLAGTGLSGAYIDSFLTGFGGTGTYVVTGRFTLTGVAVTQSGEPSAVWGGWYAVGVGVATGQAIYAYDCEFWGRNGGWYHHTRQDFGNPSHVRLERCRLAADVSGNALTLQPISSLRADACIAIDCEFSGDINYIPSTPLTADTSAMLADNAEIRFSANRTDAVFKVGDNGARALRIVSATTGTSSTVVVAGALFALIMANSRSTQGSAGFAGRSVGQTDIAVHQTGTGSTYRTSLASRIGNRSGSPISGTVTVDGGAPITVTLSADYTPATDDQAGHAAKQTAILAAINAALGSAATAAEYDVTATYRPLITAEEKTLINSSATTLTFGDVLAFDATQAQPARSVRKMTSADAASLYAGVCWQERIAPGDKGRVKTGGLALITDIKRSAVAAFVYGDTFSIGSTAGQIEKGGTQGLFTAIRSDAVRVGK